MQRTYSNNYYTMASYQCGIIGLYMTRISFSRLDIFLDLANKPKCSNKWFFNVLKWKQTIISFCFIVFANWENISLLMNKRQTSSNELREIFMPFFAFGFWIFIFYGNAVILIQPGIVSHWSIISLYFVLHLNISVVLSLYKHNVYLYNCWENWCLICYKYLHNNKIMARCKQ